eukprot:13887114-Heterocapsa_arctica.AAC.1
MGVNHGTRINFGINSRDKKLINLGAIFEILIGDYIGDSWDFLIIGNDERVLEFVSGSEMVLCIIRLGEAG